VIGVPGTNQRRTKKLETRDVNEAIQQAIDFEKEVKSKGIVTDPKNENKQAPSKEQQPYLLIHSLARYIGFLHNEDVPAHRKKERSSAHIKDVERAFRLLVECLKMNNYDLKRISINEIDDEMVGKVYAYLLDEMKFGNRNLNKHLGYFTSFIDWYSDEYDQPLKNWFGKVKRKKVITNPKAISEQEFNLLLEKITPENGVQESKSGTNGKRFLYRKWLKDAIQLGLFTGRRREEIICLKWCDMKVDDEGTEYFIVEDYKVNRILGRTDEKEKKYNLIPITNELRLLLTELGLAKYAGSDSFVLAPNEIKANRVQSMSTDLSKGFSHYYNQLGTEKKLTFKNLRKTHFSKLTLLMGGNAKYITGHSSDAVLKENYLVKQLMLKTAQDFSVFPKESDRKNQLKDIRDSKSTNKEIEK
jgi:integrase